MLSMVFSLWHMLLTIAEGALLTVLMLRLREAPHLPLSQVDLLSKHAELLTNAEDMRRALDDYISLRARLRHEAEAGLGPEADSISRTGIFSSLSNLGSTLNPPPCTREPRSACDKSAGLAAMFTVAIWLLASFPITVGRWSWQSSLARMFLVVFLGYAHLPIMFFFVREDVDLGESLAAMRRKMLWWRVPTEDGSHAELQPNVDVGDDAWVAVGYVDEAHGVEYNAVGHAV
ncbi:hypothetical protein LTR17_000986 [Elasticomyces elasticus]|nr:hypothetical protein LTR17_000986 [Elasticomyces elasticus]